MADDHGALMELYFEETDDKIEDDLIWKTVLREGSWKYRPGPGGKPRESPLTVVLDGDSNFDKGIVSMKEVVRNFEEGAVQHVTIPTSHENKVLENTGFIKGVRLEQDPESGAWKLRAAHKFTESDVEQKARNGTIANCSAGLLFDYKHKETGKDYNIVLDHVMLTNKPWINGMEPYVANLSEDTEMNDSDVYSLEFFEEEGPRTFMVHEETARTRRGGESSMANGTIELTEEQVQERLDRLATLEKQDRERNIEDKRKQWEEKKMPAALLSEAVDIMKSDQGEALGLSEQSGRESSSTASEIVSRLLDKIPEGAFVDLSEDPTKNKDLDGRNGPPAEELKTVEFTQEERSFHTAVFLHGEPEATKRLGLSEGKAAEIKESIKKKVDAADNGT